MPEGKYVMSQNDSRQDRPHLTKPPRTVPCEQVRISAPTSPTATTRAFLREYHMLCFLINCGAHVPAASVSGSAGPRLSHSPCM